jgi:hypothetical protein
MRCYSIKEEEDDDDGIVVVGVFFLLLFSNTVSYSQDQLGRFYNNGILFCNSKLLKAIFIIYKEYKNNNKNT